MRHAIFVALAAGLCPADAIHEVGTLDTLAVAAVQLDAGFRGVRLTPAGGTAVLISTHEAVALNRILRGLDADIKRAGSTARGIIGSCELRDRRGEFPVMVDYDVEGPGVRVHFLKTVLLKHKMPADLAVKLEAALDKLRQGGAVGVLASKLPEPQKRLDRDSER